MHDLTTILARLQESLSTLEERKATYGADVPPELTIEIEDHRTAIDLLRQRVEGTPQTAGLLVERASLGERPRGAGGRSPRHARDADQTGSSAPTHRVPITQRIGPACVAIRRGTNVHFRLGNHNF